MGPVYKEVQGLVDVFKQILQNGHSLDLISGHSLGAGVAQCFALGIGSTRLIMLDPQLLTSAQVDLACNTDSKAALFNKPHGIAISVDSVEKSCGGLMTRMVRYGFTHPGILWLKLPLLSSDGDGFVPKKGYVVEPPSAGKFGYHGSKRDMVLFNNAIERFVALLRGTAV